MMKKPKIHLYEVLTPFNSDEHGDLRIEALPGKGQDLSLLRPEQIADLLNQQVIRPFVRHGSRQGDTSQGVTK